MCSIGQCSRDILKKFASLRRPNPPSSLQSHPKAHVLRQWLRLVNTKCILRGAHAEHLFPPGCLAGPYVVQTAERNRNLLDREPSAGYPQRSPLHPRRSREGPCRDVEPPTPNSGGEANFCMLAHPFKPKSWTLGATAPHKGACGHALSDNRQRPGNQCRPHRRTCLGVLLIRLFKTAGHVCRRRCRPGTVIGAGPNIGLRRELLLRGRHQKSLPRGKTCGDNNIVTEMLQACGSADWFWALAFNKRVANAPPQEDAVGIGADLVWDKFTIRLLSKCHAPTEFRFLRPIAILLASAKLWSILHTALLRGKRHVPEPLALAYIREARKASMTFEHGAWRTPPVVASVGLRQGCSASPMLFRWILSDCLGKLAHKWEAEGKGVMLQSKVLTQLAWADDLW